MAAGPAVRQLLSDFPEQVRLVMKQVPSGRENAALAAEAALAAWEQGKYWEMHDQLLANAPRFDRESLLRYAREIGLDLAAFTEALDTRKHREIIARDKEQGEKIGLFATPTFLVNGEMVVGAPPYSEFKRIVEKELAQAGE